MTVGQPVVRWGISQRSNPSHEGSMFVVAALVAAAGSACAESGIASLYSTREQGTRTSSGRALHDGALTAAHKTLPFGSRVRVTNRDNLGRSVVVTITDRGPIRAGSRDRSYACGGPRHWYVWTCQHHRRPVKVELTFRSRGSLRRAGMPGACGRF